MPSEPSTSWAMNPAKPMAMRVTTAAPIFSSIPTDLVGLVRILDSNEGSCQIGWFGRFAGSVRGTHHDRGLHLPDAFDRRRHQVAGLEPAAEGLVLDLEQAAGADRAAAQDLAGAYVHVRRGSREHLRERVAGAPPRAARDLDAGSVR